MTYTAHFYGRTKGAIGVFYWIDTEVEASTADAARLALYDRFEHISGLTLTPKGDA